MTESMMGQFVRFRRFCNRRWVKWPTVIVFLTAITVAHFVMADKYGDSPNAPTWEFTITLHAAMLVAAAIIIVFYKKRIKRKLMEYGKD